MVAAEVNSGRSMRLWVDEMARLTRAPFDTGRDSVMVAYFASAELACFEALGWPHPKNTIDLFVEHRCATNGLWEPHGRSLIGALRWHRLDHMAVEEKQEMRELILSGGPWTPLERNAILDYCASDVRATVALLQAMAPEICVSHLRLGHAVLRGRYMGAAAAMEHRGLPIDSEMLAALQDRWDDIRDRLIADVDKDFGVYEGRTFKMDRFESFLERKGIAWPRLASGRLALDDDTFRSRARVVPSVARLRELRQALSQMNLNAIAVGPDGRNRTLLSPFRSKTGRNQPSNSQFIFGTSSWLRGLIKPAEGMAIAYLDFSAQEIAIAAALSGDEALWHAYESGDPYLAFAIAAKLAPADASKATHRSIRDSCKAAVLGVQYGMTAEGMAQQYSLHVVEARALVQLHREIYRRFWQWAESNVDQALLGATLTTPFGWQYRQGRRTEANPRSLLNWPMQAAGSDMLRLACIKARECGIRLCAPVHDAVVIEARLDDIDAAVDEMRSIMIDASRAVLGDGKACRVDAEIYRHPDRYMDRDRGAAMWNAVMRALNMPEWCPPNDKA